MTATLRRVQDTGTALGTGNAETSFDELVRLHRGPLLAYATRLTGGDRYRAEDALQEVWIRAWRNLDRLVAERGSVRGWLTRVTHNVVIDQHRNRSARPTEVGIEGRPDAAAAGDRHDETLVAMTVAGALDTLGEQHRAAVVEVYLRDRTAAQAATVLGVPVGTVKSRLHYALRTLRDIMPTAGVENRALVA